MVMRGRRVIACSGRGSEECIVLPSFPQSFARFETIDIGVSKLNFFCNLMGC